LGGGFIRHRLSIPILSRPPALLVEQLAVVPDVLVYVQHHFFRVRRIFENVGVSSWTETRPGYARLKE
jgi:hypothetical protein